MFTQWSTCIAFNGAVLRVTNGVGKQGYKLARSFFSLLSQAQRCVWIEEG